MKIKSYNNLVGTHGINEKYIKKNLVGEDETSYET